MSGGEADGAELLRPLRELGPAFDTFATMPRAGIAELHMDPPDPIPYSDGHQLLGDLPAKASCATWAALWPGAPLSTERSARCPARS